MPEYGWRTRGVRERCARGCSAKRPSLEWPRVDHVCHTARAPLWPRVAHAGHTWADQNVHKKLDHFAPLSLYFKTLHFPPFSQKKKKVKSRLWYSPNFSQLPNTKTFSYGVGIEWFKLEIVRIRVLYLFQVVVQLIDPFSDRSPQKNEPALVIEVEFITLWFHLF